MKQKTKQQLNQQLKFLAIGLAMIPFCWLIVILFILFAAPQLTSDQNGQDWGQLLLMSLIFSLIPGIFVGGVTYTVLNAVFGK
ncbi:MAG: hypothetical protein AAF085_13200 [Planctomycetota bacterium]